MLMTLWYFYVELQITGWIQKGDTKQEEQLQREGHEEEHELRA